MSDPQQEPPHPGGALAADAPRNRICIGLASGGIALLVTLLVAVGPVSGLEVLLAAAACSAFFLTIAAGLAGLQRRSPAAAMQHGSVRTRLDHLVLVSFLLGVALTVCMGVAAALAVLDQPADEETDSSGQYQTSAIGTTAGPRHFGDSKRCT